MRPILLYLFVLLLCSVNAQDKIYFLNGQSKEGKVLEITPVDVLIKITDYTETLNREELLLILFKNGTVEMLNTPSENAVYNPLSPGSTQKKSDEVHKKDNVSVNTLALCNADIAAFYEHVPDSKRFGFGVMGAYNFNLNANSQNIFIAILPNAKKNYDAGVFINMYPRRFKRRTSFYYGLMLKYTSFSFNATTGGTGGIPVSYSPATGSQLATLLDMGTHTFFADHFFIKTIFAFGRFRLNGDYQKQYNIEAAKNSSGRTTNYSHLPKAYFGLNIGFNF